MRRVIKRVRRIIAWLPVLWKDEDWDYACLLKLIRFKLERMYPVIKHGHAAQQEHLALQVQQAIVFLQNIEEDPDDEWTAHYNQWHMGKELSAPCPAGEKMCQKALKASAKRDRDNWHILWKHFDKYMRGWWD